jgi:ferredoxin-NADP reductase
MKVVFSHLKKQTDEIVSLYFKSDKLINNIAGQYVELTFPKEISELYGDSRWFTLCSSPTEEYISITTRIRPPISDFKTHMINLKLGDTVMMSAPMGDFVLPKDSSIPVYFICGGIGITPLRSIVKDLIDNHEKRNITLIHLVRNESDLVFRNLFESYDMNYIPQVSGQGNPDINELNDSLKGAPSNSLFYCSGPEPMVEKLVDDIAGLFNRDQIIMDYFPGYPSI